MAGSHKPVVLSFPEARSLGDLYAFREVLPPSLFHLFLREDYDHLGQAIGTRKLLPDTFVRLDCNAEAIRDPSPLETMGLDDLAEISFQQSPNDGMRVRGRESMTDDRLISLSHLSGLRSLLLTGHPITDQGLKEIRTCLTLRWLSLEETHVSDDGLALLAPLEDLRRLDLANTSIGESGARALQMFRALEVLDVAGTQVTDEGLLGLRFLTELRELNLSGTKVTARGLAALPGLPNLEMLYLDEISLDQESLRLVGSLEFLRELSFAETDLSDGWLEDLASLHRLETLHLYRIGGVVELRALADLPNLRRLSLSGSNVTDRTLEQVGLLLQSLTELNLVGTGITDTGLQHLFPLVDLRGVLTFGTSVTNEGRSWLSRALPNCEVA